MNDIDFIAILSIGVGLGTWINAEKWVGWFFLFFGISMILFFGERG